VAGERILVVGGTGFLGQHIVAELAARGHPVTVLTRSPGAAVPAGVAAVAGDAEVLDEDGFARLLDGCHGVVFAAGRDAAAPPPAPAERWFREGNVAPVAQLAAGARRAGCRSLVVCGSYLTALDRAHPRVGLVRRHPYIRSRAEQAAAARSGAGNGPAVAVLEIPFVLGATPGRSGALEPLVPWLRSRWPLVAPPGGTAVVPVRAVAQAAAHAVEHAAEGDFPLAVENLTWRQLIARLAEAAGRPAPVRVGPLPRVALSAPLRGLAPLLRLQGRESGLDPRLAASVFTAELYVDPGLCREALGVTETDVTEALRATVGASQA
jgi:nucleoside-diphosphate-sugar epimerase